MQPYIQSTEFPTQYILSIYSAYMQQSAGEFPDHSLYNSNLVCHIQPKQFGQREERVIFTDDEEKRY